ncbi:hypothetical protein Tco_1189844, partial [Tanacetum coccineum]
MHENLRFMHGISKPLNISNDYMIKISKASRRNDEGKLQHSSEERWGSNRETEKGPFVMKQLEAGQKQNFKKGGFRNQQRKVQAFSANDNPDRKRNASKFCEFHGEVGHTTDECMHLKRQIKEMLKAGKLSLLIKELKQSNRKDQRIAKQRITQTFSPESVISFPPLAEEDGTEGPMKIEAEMGEHFVHRMYVDGGSSSDILCEHYFNRFYPEIGDEEHSTSAWMNFMVVRTVTLQSSRIIPLECIMVSGPGVPQPVINQVTEEKIQVAIYPEYPEQTIAIGSTLIEEGQKELCGLLRCNLDVFAWKPSYMTGVPRHIAKHRLNIQEGCLPVRQKKRG